MVGHPRGTCGHGQVHSGRAQGTAGLVSDGALRTRNVFMAVLGQILSCGVRPMAGSALVGLGALGFSLGGQDAPSVLAEWEMPPPWLQRGQWAQGMSGGDMGELLGFGPWWHCHQRGRGPQSPSLPKYLQEEPRLPRELPSVRGGRWGVALRHVPQCLHPVLQPWSHSLKEP